MKHVDLLSTNDAMVWAKEFTRRKKENGWALEDIDESLMVGWFANAMAAQEFADGKKHSAYCTGCDECGSNYDATCDQM